MADNERANPIAEAERLLRQRQPLLACGVLEALVAGMPEDWRAEDVSEGKLRIAFWDMAEFQSHIAHFRREVFWVGPSYAKAHYLLAFIAIEAGDLPNALASIERSLQLEPDHPTALCEKAGVLSHLKRHDEALALYQRAAVVRPWATPDQKGRALRGTGVALVNLWRLNDAEGALRKSLEVDPENPLALRELEYIRSLRKGADPTHIEIVRPSE